MHFGTKRCHKKDELDASAWSDACLYEGVYEERRDGGKGLIGCMSVLSAIPRKTCWRPGLGRMHFCTKICTEKDEMEARAWSDACWY